MSENKSRLAIIIPCFNEELVVKSTVETLLQVIDTIIFKGKICTTHLKILWCEGSSR